jgi:solute carrier family 35 protein E3
MNFSLQANSVGFYQITKLVCIPVMVFIETFFYGKSFSNHVKLSLLTVIIGVAIVTVTDVKLNFLGVIYGILAVACTSMSQIALGDNQRAHSLTSLQMLENIIAPQALITVLFAIPIELIPQMDGIVFALRSYTVLGLIILSCFISISVNFFTIALIGATSAVTYQVVGHTKTCLILLLGFILFPISMPTETFIKNVGGIVIAVAGVVAYGHYKSRQ